MIRDFILGVPSITIGDVNGRPFTGNQATTGNENAITVAVMNSGNLAGTMNVTLSESMRDGTWLVHVYKAVLLPESSSRILDPFVF